MTSNIDALKDVYVALGGDADAEFSLNVEALKNIFAALGGDAAEVADLDDIPSVLSKIATVATGGAGGSSLNIVDGDLLGYMPLVIPEDVESIHANAFDQCCGNITELTIPANVTYIGDYAFRGINAWAVITMDGSVPPEAGESIFGSNVSIQIKVPADAVDDYKDAWLEYTDNISAIET